MLFIAQGFGLGKIPFAPGTFGSVLGVGWVALLLLSGSIWVLLLGTAAGFALSVWLCGVAEKQLGRKDPGSVVLDEITAMPVCFFGWLGLAWLHTGALPSAAYLFQHGHWAWTLGIFAAFRLFDIVKPWPVRQSQVLAGGWGITVDDFLAALYVSALWLILHACGVVSK